MLQQTRVVAMLPRYKAFMQRFPDVQKLARADEAEVLSMWQGLGYYRRARLLHRGAAQVLDQYESRFPEKLSDALMISGVGEYTAAAILSIAYGKPEATLDGNVRRVLARLYNNKNFPRLEEKALAQELMQLRRRTNPGLHNQAMMELGATICKPGRPDCKNCPINKYCRAFGHGGAIFAASLPITRKEIKKNIRMDIYFLKKDNLFLILKDANTHFFKNLWFLPHQIPGLDAPGYLDTGGLAKLLANQKEILKCGTFRHQITNHKIEVHVFQSDLVNLDKEQTAHLFQATQNDSASRAFNYVCKSELEKQLVSSLAHKALRKLNSVQKT